MKPPYSPLRSFEAGSYRWRNERDGIPGGATAVNGVEGVGDGDLYWVDGRGRTRHQRVIHLTSTVEFEIPYTH